MAEYRIIPLKVSEFNSHETSTLTYLHHIGEKRRCPVISYLICGNGRNILVDTGCGNPEWARKYHRETTQTPDMQLPNALHGAGVEPEELDCVINTHLHWDHCFNNDLFPGKKIYVQKRELMFAVDPLPDQYTFYESAQIGLTPPWTRTLQQYVVIDGDYELYDGIKLVLISGHTPGFQGVLVNTAKGRYLIASDAVGSYDNWQGTAQMRHIPPAIHVDLNECYRSFQKMDEICDYVLPGHDMRVFDHPEYPYET